MRRAGSSRCPQPRFARQQSPVPFGAVAAADEQLRLALLLRSRASLALLCGGKMRRAGSSRCPQPRFVRQQSSVPFGAVAAADEQLRLALLLRSRASLALLCGGKMRRAGSSRCPQLRFVRQQSPVPFGAVAAADEQLRLALLLRSRASLALPRGSKMRRADSFEFRGNSPSA